MKLNPNEKAFKIIPVGIKYVCEFCHEGEMITIKDDNNTLVVNMVDVHPLMIKHRCNKCSKEMLLPKSYPYIEWIPENEYREEDFYGSSKIHVDSE